MMIFIIIIIV